MNEKNLKCPLYKKCGGCQIQNLTYERQLSFKQVRVIKLLGRYHHVSEIIGMENPYHYRNKVQAAFGERKGEIISGVYQSSTHNIVPVDSCLIEDIKADEIIVTIRKLLKSFKLRPFNDVTMKGFLRHVLIKRGFISGEIMVVLVTSVMDFPKESQFVNALLSRHPEITTIVQNVNNKRTSLVLGEDSRVLFGEGYIEETLCGFRFRISPKAFYQINPTQTEILYNKALEFAELSGEETVLDAYCGTGTIGLIASPKAKRVVGVELNPDAVSDAFTNAELNGVKNIEFYNDDAGEFMIKAARKGTAYDVVIMDPPRAGASLDFLKCLVTLAPKRVVYISCNPETQARDLSYLTRKGYKVKKIQPVDMFPHTEHVETVALLSQRRPDEHIDITIDLTEFDTTAAELKATYPEIKEYVLNKFGLKVSSLYISQVKTKCGIIERENYNKGKAGHRVPQCPKEKEDAIMDALKHFKMI
ncbi:MAG: 23S rRNA (uracil(1939)-C(5))-methyltransferase RlmD [Clostridia bacterium]|nr:23S rRNA (uracil(1939)-C(5))-methyltransferase RlmD [Clostridia bacterium]